MRFTSASANKYLNQLNSEKEFLVNREYDVMSFTAATTENIDEVKPDYNFIETQEKLSSIEEQILKVKHALNVFNTTNTIVVGSKLFTLDTALVYMSILNSKISKYERMAKAEAKKSFTYTNGLIIYKYANYSVKDAKLAYEAAQKELRELQLALDKINNTVEFEVNID